MMVTWFVVDHILTISKHNTSSKAQFLKDVASNVLAEISNNQRLSVYYILYIFCAVIQIKRLMAASRIFGAMFWYVKFLCLCTVFTTLTIAI